MAKGPRITDKKRKSIENTLIVNPYLSIREIAELTKVSTQTVLRIANAIGQNTGLLRSYRCLSGLDDAHMKLASYNQFVVEVELRDGKYHWTIYGAGPSAPTSVSKAPGDALIACGRFIVSMLKNGRKK